MPDVREGRRCTGRTLLASEGGEAIRNPSHDWLGAQIEVEEVVDPGGDIGFVVATMTGRVPDSPAQMRVRFGAVYASGESVIVRATSYADIEKARADGVGLAEAGR